MLPLPSVNICPSDGVSIVRLKLGVGEGVEPPDVGGVLLDAGVLLEVLRLFGVLEVLEPVEGGVDVLVVVGLAVTF